MTMTKTKYLFIVITFSIICITYACEKYNKKSYYYFDTLEFNLKDVNPNNCCNTLKIEKGYLDIYKREFLCFMDSTNLLFTDTIYYSGSNRFLVHSDTDNMYITFKKTPQTVWFAIFNKNDGVIKLNKIIQLDSNNYFSQIYLEDFFYERKFKSIHEIITSDLLNNIKINPPYKLTKGHFSYLVVNYKDCSFTAVRYNYYDGKLVGNEPPPLIVVDHKYVNGDYQKYKSFGGILYLDFYKSELYDLIKFF